MKRDTVRIIVTIPSILISIFLWVTIILVNITDRRDTDYITLMFVIGLPITVLVVIIGGEKLAKQSILSHRQQLIISTIIFGISVLFCILISMI